MTYYEACRKIGRQIKIALLRSDDATLANLCGKLITIERVCRTLHMYLRIACRKQRGEPEAIVNGCE